MSQNPKAQNWGVGVGVVSVSVGVADSSGDES